MSYLNQLKTAISNDSIHRCLDAVAHGGNPQDRANHANFLSVHAVLVIPCCSLLVR